MVSSLAQTSAVNAKRALIAGVVRKWLGKGNEGWQAKKKSPVNGEKPCRK